MDANNIIKNPMRDFQILEKFDLKADNVLKRISLKEAIKTDAYVQKFEHFLNLL